MVGMSFAAVPLYRMFCAATGYGGTPKIGAGRSAGVSGQTIRVRFNADTNPGLPWTFAPDQKEVTLKLGEEQVAFYHAAQPGQHAGDRAWRSTTSRRRRSANISTRPPASASTSRR